MEEDGDGQEGSEQEELEDDGQAAFDDDMQDLENPLQTPGSERNAAAPSSLPMHDKRLYLEARTCLLRLIVLTLAVRRCC